MNDLGIHGLLFALIACVIVALSVCFSEPDDRAASRIFPKRFLTFVGGCVVVAAILLVIERTVASVH